MFVIYFLKSSLVSVICVLAFCSDGKVWSARDFICNFSASLNMNESAIA